nr:unnamed protein product [Spirometra erinaceieuropaei]
MLLQSSQLRPSSSRCDYITVDGIDISKAASGSHCVAPNDCWEIIHPGQYVILNGFLKGEQAGIVWKTELPTGRCPVGIQYKLAGTPEYPPLPSGAVSVFAKEVLKNERLIHILLFNGKRLSLSHIGNISVEKRDDNIISLLGLTARQYMIVNGFLEEYPASFVLEPKDPIGRCSVGVQYTSASISEYIPLPSGVVSIFSKEILKNERLIHILLFNGKLSVIIGNQFYHSNCAV